MNEKFIVQNREAYLKIHATVDIKTKAILTLEVTDKKIHDSNSLLNKFEIGFQSDQRSLNVLITY